MGKMKNMVVFVLAPMMLAQTIRGFVEAAFGYLLYKNALVILFSSIVGGTFAYGVVFLLYKLDYFKNRYPVKKARHPWVLIVLGPVIFSLTVFISNDQFSFSQRETIPLIITCLVLIPWYYYWVLKQQENFTSGTAAM